MSLYSRFDEVMRKLVTLDLKLEKIMSLGDDLRAAEKRTAADIKALIDLTTGMAGKMSEMEQKLKDALANSDDQAIAEVIQALGADAAMAEAKIAEMQQPPAT